ncbi:MAG: RNA methyltransferase [Armatimonadetes bacterium]|nr:RNA methyltransferase [Armatimonadota bacterium]
MAETVSGIKHPAFRDALALTRQGGRDATARYLVEDADQVAQALASPSVVVSVFAAPEAVGELAPLCAARGVPLYVLGGGLITKLLGTAYATAIQAVAVVEKRVTTLDAVLSAHPDALLLVAERIQDPRNVGVLLRTAEAAGCAALVLSADSAEAWSRQAVRSTTGSVLRLPVCIEAKLPDALAAQREKCGLRVVATSAKAPALAYDTDLSPRSLALVVGNESDGISDRLRSIAGDFVRLPMAAHGASSLNVTVAAGVLIYEAMRQAR